MKSVGQEIKEVLGKDIISDELATKLSEMFEKAVETRANELVESRVSMAVDNELEKMDEAHAKALEELLPRIDEDHTKKMKSVVEAMDKKYAEKLIAVAKKYEAQLNESAKAYNDNLNTQISNYLDMYLEKTFPKDMLKEAVENTKAVKLLAQIRDVVGMDASYINNSVKEAIKEAHDTIETLKVETQSKDEAITKLNEEMAQMKASLVLEQKTAGLLNEKREFIKNRFAGKSADEIEANFQYVLEMYNKNERDAREALRNRSINESKTVETKVDRTTSKTAKTIVEDKNSDTSDEVSYCLDMLRG